MVDLKRVERERREQVVIRAVELEARIGELAF